MYWQSSRNAQGSGNRKDIQEKLFCDTVNILSVNKSRFPQVINLQEIFVICQDLIDIF